MENANNGVVGIISRLYLIYNRMDLQHHNSFQPGGIIPQSINQTSHRVCDSGTDPAKLGHCAWTKFRGRQNISLRVVCAYRPCKSSSTGIQTVYSQHKRVFDSQGKTRDPRQALLNHLGNKISRWKDEGDQIILLIDCNSDIRNTEIQTYIYFLWSLQKQSQAGTLLLQIHPHTKEEDP